MAGGTIRGVDILDKRERSRKYYRSDVKEAAKALKQTNLLNSSQIFSTDPHIYFYVIPTNFTAFLSQNPANSSHSDRATLVYCSNVALSRQSVKQLETMRAKRG